MFAITAELKTKRLGASGRAINYSTEQRPESIAALATVLPSAMFVGVCGALSSSVSVSREEHPIYPSLDTQLLTPLSHWA
jgi:hypothetical protein